MRTLLLISLAIAVLAPLTLFVTTMAVTFLSDDGWLTRDIGQGEWERNPQNRRFA